MATITFDKAQRWYPGADSPAVPGIDLDIKDGEFMVLVGPSGCGKSTTLRMLAGLEEVTDGKIFIGDRDVTNVPPKDRDIAMVFQSYALYPHMTVGENMAFPLRLAKLDKSLIKQKVDEAARVLELTDHLDRKPAKLSGGQRQRVAMGRAIVREPRAFLMDEPLSNLDAKLREALRTELKNIQMNLGQTFLFVTHDQIEAMSMGDKIGVLNHGHLVQVGSPYEIYNNPKNTFVARAVGSPPMNLLHGKLVSGRAVMTPMSFELPYEGQDGGETDGRALTFGIRPEDIVVESGAPVEARVHDVENHGVEKIVTLRVGDTMLHATVPAQTSLKADETVALSWNPEKVVLFDQHTGNSLRHTA